VPVLLLVVLLLVLAPAADAAAATPSITRAPVRTVHAGQGTIGYRAVGSGPPVVLVMGLSGTMDTWQPSFVDALAATHRVITFDNEGIRRSTLGQGTLTIARMGRDVASLIRALHLHRADVLGWSMGGMIAQALAHDHPELVRRLVLCATAPGDGRATVPVTSIQEQLGAGDVAGLLGLLFPPGHDAVTNAYVKGILSFPHALTTAPQSVITLQLGAIARWLRGADPAGHPLGRLTLPVLVGAGARDRLLPVANARHLARALPHARLRVYTDAAHGFLFQDQAAFLSQIRAFLRQRRPVGH